MICSNDWVTSGILKYTDTTNKQHLYKQVHHKTGNFDHRKHKCL